MNPAPAEPAILACETRGLRKSFGTTRAVDGLDLRVPRGLLYAFLGPNGAGKTTSIRMISGLLRPDAGEVFIEGIPLRENPPAAKRPLAYVPDDPVLYGKLRPLEYLEFVSSLWDLPPAISQPRAEELMQTLGLADKRSDYIESFSRGMKQKMALCGALVHAPSVMLLDEPLTGLDAASARLVKDILLDFVRHGNTVILTTHILDVAERLADRIGILHAGRLAAEGTLAELRHHAGESGGTLEDIFLRITNESASSPPPALPPALPVP
jgi:ABC-2 type transport system ATP-binding protein